MKKIIFYLLLFICTSSYSQKRLSQEAINDVMNKASSYLGFEQNDKFRLAVNKYVATFNSSGASAVMANLKNDLKGREDILSIINRATANRESLFRTLSAMNVNSKNVQEIADYFFPKPVSREATVIDTAAHEETSVNEPLKPIDWTPPSKKFFDGTKTFCDSSATWYYTFTIMKSNVLLMKYPGKNGLAENKNTSVVTIKAVINGDNIVSGRNLPTNYKYENNMLYEKAEDRDEWNKYVECTGK